MTATVIVSLEHLVRGAFWPESVYGIPNPEWWRFLEHAAWVVFEDTVLVMGILQGTREMRELAVRQESLESLQASLEERVVERTLQLDASREQLRSLVESLHAVPWEMAFGTWRVAYVGPQGAKMLGCRLDDWLAPEFWSSRVHADDLGAVHQKFLACTADGGRAELEFRLRGDAGQWVWVRGIFGRPLNCATPMVRGLLFDITERRKLEDDLRESQKLESVGRLAAGVAHEINTPTQFIGDNVRFLRDAFGDLDRLITASKELVAAIDAPQRQAAATKLVELQGNVDYDYLRHEYPVAIAQSLDGVDRVAKIVYAMKDFAHADQAEKVVVDINRVIRSAATVCRNEWKYVAELVEQLDDSAPGVLGYAQDLGQVVLNLVVNAAHAIGENGGKGTITLRSRVAAQSVVVEIADSGAGIPDAIKPRIFEQFFTTKPVGKGTGQGLALAYRIVTHKHDGQISFDSTVGKGTTFRIVLPRA